MCEFLLSILIVMLFTAIAVYIIKSFHFTNHGENIEIIIDGNADITQLEKLIVSSKQVAEKYFPDVKIYIQGGDDATISMLCKTHNIFRK